MTQRAFRPSLGAALLALALALAPPSLGQEAAEPNDAPSRPRKTSAKVERYAEALVRHYDRDGDGVLVADEWAQMQGRPQTIDRDGDGRLDVAEMIDHVQRYSRQRSLRLLPPARETKAPATTDDKPLPAPVAPWRRFFVPREDGSPEVQAWFDDNDVDGDGQVTMSEFAPTITEVEAARFAEIDANGDGVIVPGEYRDWLPPEPVETDEPEPAPAPADANESGR